MTFERAKNAGKYVASTVIGGALGYLGGLYGEVSSRANVAVRPELANVDFITALLAGHETDWLFYHSPNEMKVVTTVVGAAFALFLYVVSKD